MRLMATPRVGWPARALAGRPRRAGLAVVPPRRVVAARDVVPPPGAVLALELAACVAPEPLRSGSSSCRKQAGDCNSRVRRAPAVRCDVTDRGAAAVRGGAPVAVRGGVSVRGALWVRVRMGARVGSSTPACHAAPLAARSLRTCRCSSSQSRNAITSGRPATSARCTR